MSSSAPVPVLLFFPGFFLFFLTGCKDGAKPVRSVDKEGRVVYTSGKAKRTRLELPDGSSVLLNALSVVRLSAGFDSLNREVFLEGEALFDVPVHGKKHFVLHSRALVMTVLEDSTVAGMAVTDSKTDTKSGTAGRQSGIARFKINGYPKSPGEEVDVEAGRLRVVKSYHSATDNVPETIGAGEMVMINTDIDLMEKETFEAAELKAWIDGKDDRD